MRFFAPLTRHGRRLSLSTRFGLLSAALVAMLGVIIGTWSADRIQRQHVNEAVRLADFTKTTTVYALTHLGSLSPAGKADIQAEIGSVIVDAAMHSNRIAGIVIWRDGPHPEALFSSPRVAPGARRQLPAGYPSARAGHTTTRVIADAGQAQTAQIAAIVRQAGPLLEVLSSVAPTPGMPATVVQAFVPWRPVLHTITHETIVMWSVTLGGLAIFWLALFRLVRGASRRLRDQIDYNRRLANHDPLTGLPNREMLRRRVEAAIAAAEPAGRVVALLLFDLDRFKEINDTLGHHHGDLLLQAVGPRLSRVLRDDDCIARLGGDEFVVLLPDLPTSVHAQTLGRRLRSQLSTPFMLEGVRLDVEASMGVALFPAHGSDFSTLLQHADVAMYVAKKANCGMSTYDPMLDEHSPTRLAMIGDLRSALSHPEQFELHYQPKANLKTGVITEFEALVRWRHPERGLLPPDEFIPAAERTGMIQALTDIVLAKALAQQRLWKEAGVFTPVAINLSTRSLLDPHLPDDVAALLKEQGLTGSDLDLEITESAIMADPQRAHEVLSRLADLGVRIAIDDFGTGYSSMAHLKRLPVHQIKIDKSFVIDLDSSASDAAIVRSIVDLAHNLGIGVVAEGVESEQTWDYLRDLGCTTAQGYYLARPLASDLVLPWMSSRRRSHPSIPAARSERIIT